MGAQNRWLMIVVLLLLPLISMACAAREVTAPLEKQSKVVAPPKEVQQKLGWEEDWEKTLKEARKEGKVVFYGYGSIPSRDALSAALKQKYGLEVEGVIGGGGEMATKVMNERRAGLHLVDVFLGGSSTASIFLKPAGVLEPIKPLLTLPEVVDPKLWYGGDLNWVDKEFTTLATLAYPGTVMVVNNQQVSREEMKSYLDLLNPKWKGKISMGDPTIPGNASKTFVVVGWGLLNLDYWKDFVKQEPMVTRDLRQQLEWATHGRYPIAMYPHTTMSLEYIKAGAPLEFIMPKEGAHISTGGGAISVIKDAPHPNARKIFLNWFLSREGQTVYSKAYGSQSAREDIKVEGFPAERVPGVKYFLGADDEDWVLKEVERMKIAKEIFGALVR